MTFMRYNDFENDPHAIVQGCEPERTPAGSIANRLDLSEPDSKCAFSEYDWMVGHRGVVHHAWIGQIVSCTLGHTWNYRVIHPLVHQVLKIRIWRVPVAGGLLLWLITALAGPRNKSKNLHQNIANEWMNNAVC